ncbi:hypothetical protein, partial [Nocardia sp. NPDC058497]|uniref:hypothetical protein n=1 Tax=Nocardia sp. NPDC058497 TaxID=3346529 RepID=UPI0036560FB0
GVLGPLEIRAAVTLCRFGLSALLVPPVDGFALGVELVDQVRGDLDLGSTLTAEHPQLSGGLGVTVDHRVGLERIGLTGTEPVDRFTEDRDELGEAGLVIGGDLSPGCGACGSILHARNGTRDN